MSDYNEDEAYRERLENALFLTGRPTTAPAAPAEAPSSAPAAAPAIDDDERQRELDLLAKKRALLTTPAGEVAASKKAAAAAQRAATVEQVDSNFDTLLQRYDKAADPEGARYRIRTDGRVPIRPGASEWEYIPEEVASRWQAAIREAPDPDDMEARLRGAWYLSRLTGDSFQKAFNDEDEVMQGWRDQALQPRDWSEAVRNTWQSAWISNEIAKTAYALWNKGYSGQDIENDPLYTRILELEKDLPAADLQAAKRWLPTNLLKNFCQFVPSLVESLDSGAKGGAAMGAAAGAAGYISGLGGVAAGAGGALLGPVAVGAGEFILPAIALAGFALGSSAGGALKSRELETGSTYYDLLRYRDPNSGARINPQVALIASGIYGGLAAATESLQMDEYFKAFPGLSEGAKKAVRKAFGEAIEDHAAAATRSGVIQRAMATVLQSAKSDLGARILDVASETSQEVLQQALQSGAEAIARDVSAKIDHTYITPMQTNEVVSALKDTLISSAMGFSAAHVLPAVAHLFMDSTAAGVVAHKTNKVLSAEETPEAATEIKPEDMELFRKRVEEKVPEGLHLQPTEEIEGEQYAMKAAVGKDEVGTLRYSVEPNEEEADEPGTVRILGLKKGTAPNIAAALVRSVAFRFPGWNVEWDPLSPSQAALKQYLIETNPRGTAAGLQGFYTPRDIPSTITSEYLKSRIHDVAPGWDDEQVNFGSKVLSMWGRKLGMSADELANAAITPEVFGDVMPQAAVAQGATGATAQVRVGDSLKSIIQLAPAANASTIMHEFTHAVVLFARQAAETSPQAKTFLLDLESAMGVQDGNWDGEWAGWTGEYKGGNRSAMEGLTYALEDYFATGKAPRPELEPLFKKVAGWILDIYKALKGSRVQMSPEMTRYFDDLVGGEGSPFVDRPDVQTEADLQAEQKEAQAAPAMQAATPGSTVEGLDLFQNGPARDLEGAQDALDLAKEMEGQDVAPTLIERATGWRQGENGWERDRAAPTNPSPLRKAAQGEVGRAKMDMAGGEAASGAAVGQEKAYGAFPHEDLEPIQRNTLFQGERSAEMLKRDEMLDEVMRGLEDRALAYEVLRSRQSGSLYVKFDREGERFIIRLSDHPEQRKALLTYGAPDLDLDYMKDLDKEALLRFLESPKHLTTYYQGNAHSFEDRNLIATPIYYALQGLNHGSKAGFEKFDHSYMGTGEGNQSFGWGTYLTENRDVAKKQYADRIGDATEFYFTPKGGGRPQRVVWNGLVKAIPGAEGLLEEMQRLVTAEGPTFKTTGPEAGPALQRIFEAAYQTTLERAKYNDEINGSTDADGLEAWHKDTLEEIDFSKDASAQGGHWLYKTDVETQGKREPAKAQAKVMLSASRLADGTADLFCTTGELSPGIIRDTSVFGFMEEVDEADLPDEKDISHVLASLSGFLASEKIPEVAPSSVQAWVDADGVFDPESMPPDVRAHSDAITASAMEYLDALDQETKAPKVKNAIEALRIYFGGPDEEPQLFLISNSQTPESIDMEAEDGRWVRWDKPVPKVDLAAVDAYASQLRSADDETLKRLFGDDPEILEAMDEKLEMLSSVGDHLAEVEQADGHPATGQDLYTAIEGALESPKAASLFLYGAGFDGTKYPVAFLSGGKGDKGFNYVVFNEGALSITKRVLYQGEFGHEWAVPAGETQRAIDTLMSIREGVVEAAAHREGIGDIAIPWGRQGDSGRGFSGGFGLSKIVGKHEAEEEDVLAHLADVLQHGAIYTDPAPGHEERVLFMKGGYRAVVSMTREFNGKTEMGPWLVTAYKDRINAAQGLDVPPAGAQMISPAASQAEGGALPSEPGAASNLGGGKRVVKIIRKKPYLQAEAWHGSPADIESSDEGGFSTDHIGEGEGNQAFGWGLYFTSEEQIARWYAHKLTKGRFLLINGDLYEWTNEGWQSKEGGLEGEEGLAAEIFNFEGSEEEAIAAIDRALKGEASAAIYTEASTEQLEAAKRILQENNFKICGGRHLYKIIINHGKDDVWLDWNQPLAGQSPEAQAALLKAGYFVPKQEELEKAYNEAESQLADAAAEEREDQPGEPEVEVRYNKDDETWDYYLDGEYEGWAKSEEDAGKEAQAAAEKAAQKAQENWYIDIRQSLSTDDIEKGMREILSREHNGARVVNPDMEGEDLYKLIVREEGGGNPWSGDPDAPKNASLNLAEAGFTGIRYPAASLGGGAHGLGTNYVVFDDKLLEIEDHILYQNGRPLREAIPTTAVKLYQANDGDEAGVSTIKEIARESAERGESWQEFMDYAEAMFTDEERAGWQMPQDLPPDQKRAWYKTIFDEAQRDSIPAPDLAGWVVSLQENDHEKLLGFLKRIWTDVLVAERRDLPPGADEEEARQWSEGKARAQEIKSELAEPIVAAAARVGSKGDYLMPAMRASLMGIIKANPEEYAAIYGELMGDEQLKALGEQATAKKYEGIEPAQLEKAMSISQRAALAESIRDEQIARQVRTGEIVVGEEVKGLLTRNREAIKEGKARIAALEDEAKVAAVDLDEQQKALVGAQAKYRETKQEIARLLARGQAYADEGEESPSLLESRRTLLEKQQQTLKAKLQAAGDWMTAQEDLDALKEEAARTDRAIKEGQATGEPTSPAMLAKRSEQQARIRALEAKLKEAKDYKTTAKLQTYLAKLDAIAEERGKVQQAQAEAKALKQVQAYRNRLEAQIMRPVGDSVDVHYAQQIHAIQATLDPEHPNARTKEKVALLREELEQNPALAHEVSKKWLKRALGKSFGEMSLTEMEDTAKRVQDLRQQGKAIRAQIKRDRADVSLEAQIRIAESVMGLKGYKEPAGYEPEKGLLQKLKSKVREFDFAFLSMQRFANMMDGGKEGFNYETLWNEMNSHYREEMQQRARRVARILAAFDEAGVKKEDWYNTQVNVPGCGPGRTDKMLRKSDLMALEMAFRNEDSRQAALFGCFFSRKEKEALDEEELLFEGSERFAALRDAIDSVMTPKDQQVLEIFAQDAAETAPRLAEVVARAENREMMEVDDYFPIIRQLDTGIPLDVQVAGDVLDRTAGTKRPPRNGFTKERVTISPKKQSPIKLDLLSTWMDSINRQEHYIATAEYGKRLDSFYLSPYVQEQIRGAFGEEGADYVKQYLAEVKNPGSLRNKSRWENSIMYLRGNLGAAYLAFRASSVLKQLITSPWPTLPYAGPRMFVEALRCLANPVKFLRETEALSTYLTNRTADLTLEAVKEAKASAPLAKALLAGERAGMKGLELADRFSVAVVWRACYERALEEFDGDTTKAEAKADNAIMKTQPSARGVDLAPIYRDKGATLAGLLQFTQAVNVIWQNVRYDLPTALKNHQYGTAIGIGVSYAIAGILLNAATEGMKGDESDEEKRKKIAFWALTQGTDSIPLIGQDATRIVRRWVTGEKTPQMTDTALPAIAEMLQGMYNLGGGEIDVAAEKFARSGGMVLGMPVSGIREGGRVVTGDFGALLGRPADKD